MVLVAQQLSQMPSIGGPFHALARFDLLQRYIFHLRVHALAAVLSQLLKLLFRLEHVFVKLSVTGVTSGERFLYQNLALPCSSDA